jgi:hypothetical protein
MATTRHTDSERVGRTYHFADTRSRGTIRVSPTGQRYPVVGLAVGEFGTRYLIVREPNRPSAIHYIARSAILPE